MNAHAKLSIHSQGAGLTLAVSPLERLRGLYSSGRPAKARLALSLSVADLQGCEWFAMADVGSQVDVLLPAGTYNVTAVLGQSRRSYTLALQSGATFDLHLPLAMARH